jgi:hypothetical protein
MRTAEWSGFCNCMNESSSANEADARNSSPKTTGEIFKVGICGHKKWLPLLLLCDNQNIVLTDVPVAQTRVLTCNAYAQGVSNEPDIHRNGGLRSDEAFKSKTRTVANLC